MQDAVLLANHLYDIKPTSFENIKKALSDYKEERFEAVKEQYPQSYMAAKLMYGHVSLFLRHQFSSFLSAPLMMCVNGAKFLFFTVVDRLDVRGTDSSTGRVQLAPQVNDAKAAPEEHCLPSSSQFPATGAQARDFGYHSSTTLKAHPEGTGRGQENCNCCRCSLRTQYKIPRVFFLSIN